ncbi:FolC bifunctional protein [Jaminaea rosea]|uniref:Folylpolyglutamate synthase n=1 Tax=Jaminaea rosea TaxID=1569628 RepID=A0A316UYR2_9BASI|nr:FolC bifunctional protein [Jaminaea rosea]PWN30430.1 FolC bifunctional protein [Jaminaea rosea]
MAFASSSSSSTAATPPPRSYASAIEALNTLQSNAATIAATRAAGGKYNDWLIPEMVEYLERAGHSQQELDRLNVIHITGTKGKGSTAAFSNSLLLKALADQENGDGTVSTPGPKVGLYTSPHMLLVRERIRLDGMPIDEETFTRAFWRIWDAFEATADQRARPEVTPARPVYFKFLTVLALHIFLSMPSIRAVILEVGIGGRYDSTNIVPKPVACGISTLSLDHQVILGNSIEEIASQKAGIYKRGAPAISVAQPFKQTEAVLRKAAEDVGAKELKVLPEVAESPVSSIRLGLPGPHQVSNAQLALNLVDCYLKAQGIAKSVWKDDGSPSEWATDALASARWPGRCQIVPTSSATFYLDGAHTSDSLALCAQWWQLESPASASDVERTLIFNCTNGRNANELLSAILSAVANGASYFTRIVFCTNIPYRPGARSGGDLTNNMVDSNEVQSLSVQRDLQSAWAQLVKPAAVDNVHVLPSIEDALDTFKGPSSLKRQHVMVAGSLHLVGGVMSHLKDAGALDEKLEAVQA